MFVCGCGRWMHTEGIEERWGDDRTSQWFVRSECRGCGLRIGIDLPPGRAEIMIDRLIWTDEARHRLDRLPPYVAPLVRHEVEQSLQKLGARVVTYEALDRAGADQQVSWDPEAERRLANVPAAVRAMARIELERTASERGDGRVTIALMEEVKARYFGMGTPK